MLVKDRTVGGQAVQSGPTGQTVNQRVLHLIHSDQPRGAEVFAVELASHIEGNGVFDNGICTLYPGRNRSLPVGDLPMFRLDHRPGTLGRLGLDPGILRRLLRAMKEFRPDILVAHGSDTLKYSACASVFYRKVATIYRNIGTASIWANSPVKVGVNRLFLRRMDAIVSVSQYTGRDFMNVYRLPPSRVTVIPNGVDAQAFQGVNQASARAQVRQELEIPESSIVLISVGNLSQEKGYADLLSFLGDLSPNGIENHLVLVGEGPLREPLQQQARQLGLADRVHFLGRRSDVPQLLSGSDLFVLPSKTEGMPAVLIEAGLAGLPSVAFNVGGVAEVVDHGVSGLLAAPGDQAGFSQALAWLCRDQGQRTLMGAAARDRCRERFDIHKIADDYQELFRRILSTSPSESGHRRAHCTRQIESFQRKGNGQS